MFKLVLEKAEEPEIKLSTSAESSKKQESGRKTAALLTMPKPLTSVDHKKLWKILKEMGMPDHLTCLLRNLYAGQEATVRTGHGTTDGSKSGKEYVKAVYCHPTYLTYMQSTIKRNARLDQAHAGIKIAGRNINLRYAHDTTLMAECFLRPL